MHDFNAIATAYIDAFNAIEPASRKDLIAAAFTDDVTYVDPLAAVDGRDGIEAFIAGAHDQFPGWVFTLAGQVDGHHDQARFSWGLGPEGEEPKVVGFDVVALDGQGCIKAVYGFLDLMPSM